MIPPRGIKIIMVQKRTITIPKLKSKILFLGEEIKQKEIQMGPHRGSQDDPARGIKKITRSIKDDYQLLIEKKKCFSRGRNKPERDFKWDTIGYHLSLIPPRRIKQITLM